MSRKSESYVWETLVNYSTIGASHTIFVYIKGRVPAHISTALMFAVLKQFKMKAEMVGDPKFLPGGRVIEKWRLIKA